MLAVATSVHAGAVHAGAGSLSPTQYQIPTGALVCVTEQTYEDQMTALAQGYNRTIQGCGVASKPIDVIILESNVMSASKVRAVQNGVYLFVGPDGLEAK